MLGWVWPCGSPLTLSPPQYLVSIPLRMFRLWAFTGMMAQVSALQPFPTSSLRGQSALWPTWPPDCPCVLRSHWPGL